MDATQQGFKVLIVDDDADVRERLSNILTRRGYFVLTAENGREGSNKVVEHKVDIIICDIYMPDMDGLEFMKKVRETNLNTELIIVTGKPTIEVCVASFEKDAVDYLTKPLTVEGILKSVGKAEKRIHEKVALHPHSRPGE